MSELWEDLVAGNFFDRDYFDGLGGDMGSMCQTARDLALRIRELLEIDCFSFKCALHPSHLISV